MGRKSLTRYHVLPESNMPADNFPKVPPSFPLRNAVVSFRLKALLLGAIIVLSGASRAQTLSDLGTSAPTPAANDIFQLSSAGNKTAPDGLNYYTDNQTGHSSGEPGQTFTTGSNPVGYVLTSLAVKTAGLNSYNGISTPQPYYLHIYSVSGSAAALLQTYVSANLTFNDGDWLQWNGLSVVMTNNATYAWSFGKASTTTGWEAMAVATNNLYGGGEVGLINPITGAITSGSSHSFDAVFDIGLIPSTLPNISQITVSPTNNAVAGIPTTLTASVTGTSPLSFQWQFNNGGGYTNISGATTNSLALTPVIADSGSYRLVLTNNYGATTSAPVWLSVVAGILSRIAASPTNDVFAGTPMTFTANVTAASPFSLQWRFNNGSGYADLPGANTNTLSFTATVTNTGSYELVLSNAYGVVTSAPVALSVTLDTNPPVVLRAFNIGLTNVELDFSKPLEATSATDLANYSFTSGLVVTAATLTPDNLSILLTTAPLVYNSNYTITINGIRDRAIPPNTIATNTRISFAASPRQRISLDAGWRFQIGDPPDVTTNVTVYPEISNLAKLQLADINSEIQLESQRPDPVATHAGENVSFVLTNYDDSGWRTLDLPHDWFVELPFTSAGDVGHGSKATSGNTVAWYRHTFTLPSADANKTMFLEFDGIYRNALIWLNGHCIGRDVSGYAPISFDVTPYLNAGGTNVLVVRVDATRTEGWFYEGAGIYRHVWLTVADPVHVGQWGTFVATTSLVGSNATITVQTTVANQSALAVTGSLTSTIMDANSNSVTEATSALSLAAGQGIIVTQTLAVVNANLWSLQTPYLYNLISSVSNATALADIYHTTFGVRVVRFDPTNGVFINGQHVEIQGMCNHQDHAGVGSALPDRLQYFRIERLKQMGVNAYRTSHNAPTAELLDACDRLGMLVLDETRRIGYDPEALGQLERMIRRDRNHPCVFAWSLANEEPLQGDSVNGVTVMQAMQNLAHSLDSTRLCTAAMSGGWGSGFSLVLDVTGFNYSLGSLDSYHSSHSVSNIIGTETSSEVGTRGIYTNDAANGYVRAYDDNAVSWGETAEAWWQFYSARPWSSGGFCWTGFDYRGEPTPYGWPCINSHFGIMDTCGFPKDLFYYYQANWTLKPVLHLFPHWNWSTPGQPINVWAFGNCQSVELVTNGVSLGRQTLNVQGHVEWDNVPYSPGTLQAIAYNNGVPVLTNTVTTTGLPASITLWPDRSTILADGRDVSVVTVAVVDTQGRVVPTATNNINFTISGGAIIGVGNGNPSSHEADKASQRAVFNGLAQVVVQAPNHPGAMTLTATSSDLISTNITLIAATTLPPPDAPTGVVAVGGNAQVTITWDITPGATTYNLWRATTSGGPYTLVAGDIGSVNLGYVDNDVTNFFTYYYTVNANGNGVGSNSVQVSAMPVPTATGLTAMTTNGHIMLSWNGTPGAAYNVKRATATGGPYVAIASSIASTNYTDTNVVTCQNYFYVVTVVSGSYESLPSVEAAAEVPGLIPPSFTSTDIGSVGLAGNASYCGGEFTIAGSGADIWGASDAFQFVYTYVPISTNCDIRARVLNVQNTSGNAKAAVMIRETLAAGSRHALADIEPSAGIEFLWRPTTSGGTSSSVVSGTAPKWVRLTRTNNTFTAYWSTDGNAWTQIGSPTDIVMSVSAYIGLAVCAHNNAAINTSLIDNFSASFLPVNTAPALNSISNQTVNAGQTITLTAKAMDTDAPPQTLTFSLLKSPVNATVTPINSTNAVVTWRPWITDAATTNVIALKVSDNGLPSLSATQSFVVMVNPLVMPTLSPVAMVNGQLTLQLDGPSGPDFAVEISTNLSDWSTLLITNSPAMPWEWADTNTMMPARFYRVKTGPPL
jgi:beta-galactosidase